MSYQVIARRWRPQNFDEVIFQDHVSVTIRNSIRNNRISHAYIFTGPRGVGKTTSARILAKALNCLSTDGPTPDPCGKCRNCLEITEGNSFDVMEIDGASNNSVDNIRDLREKVNFAPVNSRYKIYIIDEVHMLSTGAFNALLKTLEEPPSHVVFIFATTEIHKVPDTILSRCQKYFFKKIDPEHVVKHLKTIAEGDGYTIQERALYAIARASGGSMRDAQSLLEQVLSFSEGEIKEDAALAILGVLSVDSYLKLLDGVAKCDPAVVVTELNNVVSTGADIMRYSSGFLDIVRTIRLIQRGLDVAEFSGFSPVEIVELQETGANFSSEEMGVFFKILNSLINDLKYSDNERIQLEMALLDMLEVHERPSLSAIISQLENLSKKKTFDGIELEDSEQDIISSNKTTSVATDVNSTNNEKSDEAGQSFHSLKLPYVMEKRQSAKLWEETVANLKSAKPMLFQKIVKCVINFEDDCVKILLPEKMMGRIKISFDENDLFFLSELLKKLTEKAPATDYVNEKDFSGNDNLVENGDVSGDLSEPVKNDSATSSETTTGNSPKESYSPVVQKLVDTFFGEVVDVQNEDDL